MAKLKTYKLGELTTWKSGGTPPKLDKKYWGGAIPWISAKNLTSYTISTSDVFITQAGLDKGSRLANEDSILLLVRGSGLFKDIPVGIVTKAVAFNQDVKAIEVDKSILDPWYLLYWIKGNKALLNTKLEATGIGAGKFDLNILKELEITLTSIEIQQKVAAIARCWDDKIELNRRMNQTLEQMAQTLFRQYFVDCIDEDNLPNGWQEVKVQDVFNITIGRTPPRAQKEWFTKDPTDVKWISIRDLGNYGVYIFDTSEYLTEAAVKKFNVPIIPENTVVLSFKLTVGRVAITTDTMLSNEAIAHFIPMADTYLTPEFVYLYLKEFNYDSLGNTSSIATAVNSKTIKDMPILLPDQDKVAKYTERVKAIFEKIKANAFEITTLTQLRDTLLPKLMSGEVDVMQTKPDELHEPVLS